MGNYQHAGGRPKGQANADATVKEQFFALVDLHAIDPETAAVRLGYAARTGRNWLNARNRGRGGADRSSRRPGGYQAGQIPPKRLEELDDAAYASVQDTPEAFELFRKTYLGRDVRPWQQQAGIDLLAAEHAGAASEDALPFYAVLNVFPGGGKSTTITHDWVVWRIVCHRARGLERRVQLGSRTITQAKSYTLRVRQTLESNIQLLEAFGRFKPLEPIMWESTAFMIEQLPGVRWDEKEPTVFAVSQESGFLGFRGHICIWDDLISKANSRTAEGREALRIWWADEAESRVEPGGLVALVGTRLGPHDLFRTLSELRVVEDEGDLDDPQGAAGRPIYHTITYPVHDESRCLEPAALAPAAHPDCLNDPKRYSWRRILRLKVQLGPRFQLTYQQDDTDGEAQLVRRAWLEGGEDTDGSTRPGCYDYERGMWELVPPFALEDYRACITVDPSPTNYWAVQLWVFDRKHDLDYLVAQERKRMTAPDLLDLKPGTLDYTGLLEEWLLKAREMGLVVRHLIVEQNAAQRFMLQYAFFRDWARSRQVIIRGHNTSGPGLSDPIYGIEMLAPRYMHGQIRLPMKGIISKDRVTPLVRELLSFPDGDTNDCVMSQWFGHYNRDKMNLQKVGPSYYSRDEDLSPALAAARHGRGTW